MSVYRQYINYILYSKEIFLGVEVKVMLERRAWYLMGGPPLGLWDRNDFSIFFLSESENKEKLATVCTFYIIQNCVHF